MSKIIAIIIISVWAIIGIIGVLRCEENRVNIEMLFFVLSAPFLAFVSFLL